MDYVKYIITIIIIFILGMFYNNYKIKLMEDMSIDQYAKVNQFLLNDMKSNICRFNIFALIYFLYKFI